MNRIVKMKMGWAAIVAAGVLLAAHAAPPPPPPGGGGGIKPPDAPPPGKIYFEDNVVIVGPGFVKPDSDGGTVYIDIQTLDPDKVNPDKVSPSKTVERIIREVAQVKTQVEAGAVALPPGMLNPASVLLMLLGDEAAGEKGIFDDPAFLSEEAGNREPAATERPGEASAGGAAVKAAPDAPAPSQFRRSGAGAAAIPSYWQLPIR